MKLKKKKTNIEVKSKSEYVDVTKENIRKGENKT